MSDATDATGTVDAGAAPTDGRTARRERNRESVLDAVIDLFAEGHLEPSPQQVADRSGVSLRSVYRYYEDDGALARAAIGRNVERLGPLLVVDRPGEGTLESRVRRMVATRLALVDAAAPLMRAAVHRAGTSEVIRDRVVESRAALRAQVAAMFEPELAALAVRPRREVLDALDVLLSFASFEQLLVAHGRSRSEAAAAIERALLSLLGT